MHTVGLGIGFFEDPIGWTEDQLETGVEELGGAASDAADAVGSAATALANFVASLPPAVGDKIRGLVDEATKDPAAFVIALATLGPLGFTGDPEELLRSVGIVPAAILKSLGLPATPAEVLQAAGVPATPQAILQRAGLPTTPDELSTRLGLGQISKLLPRAPDPQAKAKELLTAVKSGNLDAIKNTAIREGHQLADGLAFLPGLGTALAVPLSTAVSALETGSPLIVAIELLLAGVPLPTSPLNFKEVLLRPAVHALVAIVEGKASVEDAFLNAFKTGLLAEATAKGFPDLAKKLLSELLDAIIQVILRHKPLDQQAAELATQALKTASDDIVRKFGVAIPQNIRDQYEALKGEYAKIKAIGNKANEIYAATQGIVQLGRTIAALGPLAGAALQAQVKGLQAGIAAKQMVIQSLVASGSSQGRLSVLARLAKSGRLTVGGVAPGAATHRSTLPGTLFGLATIAGIVTLAVNHRRIP